MNFASAQPAPRAAIAVVCFGFDASTWRRQPWHVAHGLASGFAANGHPTVLLTDAILPPEHLPYPVQVLADLRPASLRRALTGRAIERVYLITGATALARMAPLELEAPVSLVLASPRLRVRELARLGRHLWHERELLGLPLLGALLPGRLLRRGFRRSGANEIVYLSRAAQARYADAGLPAGRRLTPQIDVGVRLASPPRRARPLVAYLGPPLEARGAWLAVATFEAAVAQGLDADLRLLIRPDVRPAQLDRFRARVEASPCREQIELEVGMLSPARLRGRLEEAAVLLLPFRVPVSEVPLVVLEAGASGRRVVTLDAPGVGEYAAELGGIVTRESSELPAALIGACSRPLLAPPPAAAWSRWDLAVARLREPRDRALDRARFIGLIGVDGAGKSFLLRHLQGELRERGMAHRHVWSRFRNYTSKPLLGLLRLTGHNRKEHVNGTRVGYHDLQRSPVLGLLFLALQVVDQVLDLLARYRLTSGRRLVVGDRCVFDTLVDLCIDTGCDDLILRRIGPWLVRLLPRPRCVILIRREVRHIHADRPDALADRHFARRRALYERLARDYGLSAIDNNGPPDAAVTSILARAAIAAGGGR